MTVKKIKSNSLKDKFNKLEMQLNPDCNEIKLDQVTESEAQDLSKLKVNAKKITSHHKVLANVHKQLDKNKSDLEHLLKIKEDNHLKLEQINQAISETRIELSIVERTIKELQHDRINDQARHGRLQTKKVELENDITSKKRQRELLTSDYQNLLNAIYLKEAELNKISESLAVSEAENAKLELARVRESKNLNTISDEFEKNNYKYQKTLIDNRKLNDELKSIKTKVSDLQQQIDFFKTEVIKLHGDNERIQNHILDLNHELSAIEGRYSDNRNHVDILRNEKSELISKRDDLLNQIKSLKSELSKNLIEIDVRNREKLALEKETNDLLTQKTKIESEIFSQKATIQAMMTSIKTLNRDKNEITDTIKLNQLHYSRYETDILKLRKETEYLQASYNVLIVEGERVKNETQKLQHGFITVEKSRNDWYEKKEKVENEIKTRKNEIEMLLNKQESYAKDIDYLKLVIFNTENDIKKIEVEHESVLKRTETIENEYRSVASEHKRCKNNYSAWVDRISNREDYIQNTMQKMSSLKEEIFQLSKNSESSKNLLKRLELKVQNLIQEQRDLTEQYNKKTSEKIQIQSEIEKLQILSSQLETEKSQIEKQVRNMQEVASQHENKYSLINDEYENIKSAIEGAKKQIKISQSQIDGLTLKIKNKEQALSSLQQEFTELHQQIQKMQGQNENLTKKVVALSLNKVELDKKLTEKRKLIKSLPFEKQQKEIELAKIQKDIMNLGERDAAADAEINKTTDSIAKLALTLQSAKETSKNKLIATENKEDQINKLKARANNLEQQIREFYAEQLPLKNEYSELSSDIQTWHEKNANLAIQLESELVAKSSYIKKIEVLKKEIEKIKDTYMQSETNLTNLKSENSTYQNEYKSLLATRDNLLDNYELQTKAYIEKDYLSPEKNTPQIKLSGYTNISDLTTAIKQKCHSRNSNVMLEIVNQFIDKIMANEFPDVKWQAKVDSNNKLDGLKLRFKGMQTRYTELKRILKPLMNIMTEKFSAYGVNITMNTKTSPGEVVEILEIVVTIATQLKNATVNSTSVEL